MNVEQAVVEQFEQHLPEPISRKLRSVVRRIRRVILIRGLLAVAAVTLGTLLALMAVDAVVVMSSVVPRVVLTGAGMAAVLASCVWFVLRPLRRRLSLAAIARIIEAKHPELEERISSTVELRGAAEAPEGSGSIDLPRGSEELIAALAEEATLDAGSLEPRKEVSSRSVRPYLLAALALAGLLGLIFALWPRYATVSLQRVIVPIANVGNLPAIDLDVKPGDRVVAIGEPVTIEVEAAEGDFDSAELELIDTTGYETRQKGTPVPVANQRQRVVWEFPAVMSAFQYRVHAGRALSEYFTITAVPRPKVEAAEVRLDFPAYTELKPQSVPELPKLIEAVAGTKATLTLTTNTPLARPQLMLNGNPAPEPTVGVEERKEDNAQGEEGEGDGDGKGDSPIFASRKTGQSPGRPTYTWSFDIEPQTSGPATLAMEEEHGITGDTVEFEVRAVADNPPTVDILVPQSPSVTLKPRDRLTIQYRATDDFGLGTLEMLVRMDDGEPSAAPLAIPPDVARPLLACEGEAILDLATMDLGQAKQLTVQIRVSDTLPEDRQGPNRALSKPLVIVIDRSAEPPIAENTPSQQSPNAETKPEETPLTEAEKRQMEEELRKAEELAKLAEQQEQLADQAEAKKPEEAPEAAWTEQEQKVAEQLAEAIQKSPEAMREELQAQSKQAAEMSQEAQQLAQEEQRLREQTQAAADPQADREKLKEALMQELAREQKAIAQETAQLQAEAKQAETPTAENLAKAEQEMNQATEKIEQRQPGQAAQEARQAEEQLRQAAEAQNPQSQQNAAQPEASTPEQQAVREKAEQLAQAQENVAEALEAVEKGNLQEALAQMQENVRQEAEQLQGQAEQMASQAASLELPQPTQSEAQQAAQSLEQASQHAAEAQQAMAQSPSQAVQPEQQAQQSLEQAAESLADLSRQLGEQAQQMAGTPPSQPPAGQEDLLAAFHEATEAAQADNAQEASESARAAAEELSQAAEAVAQRAQSMASHSPPRQGRGQQAQKGRPQPRNQPGAPGDRSERPGQMPPQPAGKLKPLEIKGKNETDWAHFHGQMKREAGDAPGKDADDEYRELIGKYFEELSKQGGKK